MQNFAFYGIAVAAVILYSVQPVLAKKIQFVVPPFAFMAMTMAVLAVLAFIASLIFERQFRLGQVQPTYVALVVLFGVVNFFSFWLFLKALSGIPAAHYQIIGGVLAPILGALFAAAIIGEAISVRFLIAIPFAFVTLYIALLR